MVVLRCNLARLRCTDYFGVLKGVIAVSLYSLIAMFGLSTSREESRRGKDVDLNRK